jgi:hypothetical protein
MCVIFSTKVAVRHSIVASIPACHAGDQGSIPCVGEQFYLFVAHVRRVSANILLLVTLVTLVSSDVMYASSGNERQESRFQILNS